MGIGEYHGWWTYTRYCTPYYVDGNDDIYDNHARGDNDIFKDDDGDNHVKEYGEPRIPFVPGINFLH